LNVETFFDHIKFKKLNKKNIINPCIQNIQSNNIDLNIIIQKFSIIKFFVAMFFLILLRVKIIIVVICGSKGRSSVAAAVVIGPLNADRGLRVCCAGLCRGIGGVELATEIVVL